ISKLMSEFRDLCVVTGRFAHSALDGRNIRNLGTDVKMDELEAMREACGLQHFARRDETRGIETKFRILTTAWRPFARALTVKTYANSDVRLDADFFCRPNRLLQFFQFFGNDDHLLAELATKQRDPDERSILVTVANDQTLCVLMHRQRRNQLRLA